MDPRLRILAEEASNQNEVAVLARLLRPVYRLPAAIRVVAAFGDVVTLRVPPDSVSSLREHVDIVSLKAPWLVSPESEFETNSTSGPNFGLFQERTLSGLDGSPLTGQGVVIGVIDWGLDLTHPAFRREDGSTRVSSLWNQQPGPVPGHSNRYGYGRIYSAAEIDTALKTADPEMNLGYYASASDSGSGSHGTATTSIAAGREWQAGLSGVAPDAEIVFVQLSTWGPAGPQRLGDCVALAEALDFIRSVAAGRPFVINLSLGGCGGPHDGTSLIERAMDNIVRERPGQLIVQSCGNYYTARKHSHGRVEPGEKVSLKVFVPAGTSVSHDVEVWYGGVDRFDVSLKMSRSPEEIRLRGEGLTTLTVGGHAIAQVAQRHNDPGNGRNHILVRIAPSYEGGQWELNLIGSDVRDGRFDSWIERDPGPAYVQAHFSTEQATKETTTGTICNGWQTIVVGAYNHHDPASPVSEFSSSGPTVDGRRKPDFLAPGTQIVTARNRRTTGEVGILTRMSGTSMATPYVTGLVACLLQTGSLDSERVRSILAQTSRPYVGVDFDRAGFGYCDPVAAVTSVLKHKELAMAKDYPIVESMDEGKSFEKPKYPSKLLTSLGTTARELAEAFVSGSAPAALERLRAKLEVITSPAERLDPELRSGDLLIRAAVGEGHARVSLLVDGRVLRRDRAEKAGWKLEGTQPGYFSLVVEDGVHSYSRADHWARRLAGLDGQMPQNQCIVRTVSSPEWSGDIDNPNGFSTAAIRMKDNFAEASPIPNLRSELFVGDAQLAAVAAGNIRLGARGTAPYPKPAQSNGGGVAKLQVALIRLGYPVGKSGVDGIFGSDTGKSVARYKRDRGIRPADPVVGPQTIRRLDAELPATVSPQPPATVRKADQEAQVTRWVRALGPQTRPGNRATALIDGAETYASYLNAIRTATGAGHFIYLLGWYLDLDVPLSTADSIAFCGGSRDPNAFSSTLRKLLAEASNAGVQVRVMLWDKPGGRIVSV